MLLAAAGTLCVAIAALAQDTLGVATVSARRLTPDVVPVQQLSGPDLARLGGHSVADALRFFSGAQLKDYGGVGGLKTVNVRGMGSHHVGVFLDGVAVGNAQNGVVDLGRFSTADMESLALYSAQRTRLLQPAGCYGSAAALYMESRRPGPPAGRRHALRAALRGGSFGTLNPSVRYDARLTPDVAASLTAEYLYADGRYRFRYRTTGGYDTAATRRGGDVEAFRTEAALQGGTRGGEWRARAYFYGSQRGLPGAIVRNRLAHADRQWDTNAFVQGSLRQRVARNYDVLLTAKYAYDRLRYLSDPRRDAAAMFCDERFRQQELLLSSAHRLRLSADWSAAISVDYKWNRVDADGHADFDFPTRHTLLAAAAAEGRLGGLHLHGSLLATLAADRTHPKSRDGRSTHTAELSPTLTAAWKPRPDSPLELHAFAKSSVRLPSMSDRYYTIVGRAELEPERARQVDVGLQFSPRQGSVSHVGSGATLLSLDAYYNKVENKIVAVPAANQFRWTMMNLGRVEILGLDAAAQTAFRFGSFDFGVRAAYTFEQAADVTSKADPCYRDQIPYVPWHSGSLTASLGWRGWTLGYSFVYTGKRYDQRANIPENFVPAWYTSDLSLVRQWKIVRLTVQLNNIFNQHYDIVKGYPMPGFHAFAKVEVEI